MAYKHRKRSRTAKRATTIGVATATVTALTIGSAPPPQANSHPVPTRGTQTAPVALTAAAAGLISALAATPATPGFPAMPLAPDAPDPASIPDLSFGLGTEGYDLVRTLGAALESGALDDVNLSGLLQYLGYDPTSAINTALGTALTSALAGVPIDLSGIPVLGAGLSAAGVNNVAALLSLLGFDLADPLNLAGVPTPGINVITAGPLFSVLKFAGVDLGWVPGFPNSVADEINGTPYLDVSALGVLDTLIPLIPNTLKNLPVITALKIVQGTLQDTGDINVIDARVPVVAGFGIGAFAAGAAYQQVVADLPNQPGGANYTGTSPLAGSLTLLPLILLRNPGRANGGLFARFYPEAALLGIDTITPDTEVSSSTSGGGLNTPVGTTGVILGGANLVPIKVDGTVEYDPLSDFPAWPNPVSLANSAAALLFPTYILRGVTAASLTEVVNGQVNPQLASALGNTTGPLALNLYLTVPVNDALPLLEPIKLPVDVINLFTGLNLDNPIATALEPALTSLVNLGYTDVQRTVVNGVPQYDRTLDQAGVITPFGSLPQNIDWDQVPGDLFVQLGAGVQQAIAEGFVSDTPVVVLPEPAPSTAKVLTAKDTGPTALAAPAAAKRAQARADASVKQATDRLDKIAKDGQKQIRNVVKGVQGTAEKAAKTVSGTDKADKSADQADAKKAE